MLDASKVRGDYFKAGKSHVCRFCHTPIQKKFGGRLLPIGNYCMWTLELSNGVLMSVNSCKDCRDQYDSSNVELNQATLDSNVAAWRIKGESLDRLKAKILGSDKVTVKSGTTIEKVDHTVDAIGFSSDVLKE